MTNISQLVDDYCKLQTEFQEKGKALLITAFSEFFQANPEIKSILWCQYTPYFNDGDECIFSVHDMVYSLSIDEIEEANRTDVYGDEERFYSRYTKGPHREAFDEFTSEIMSLPNEIYKETFGDHVMVLATREGFHTEEYDHD